MSGLLEEREILSGIEEVAREHLAWRGELGREVSLVETLRLDSLRLLTLVVEIENRFRITLEEGSEASIRTVGDLVDAIRSGLASAPGHSD